MLTISSRLNTIEVLKTEVTLSQRIIYAVHKIEVWKEGHRVRRILNEAMTYPRMYLRTRTSLELFITERPTVSLYSNAIIYRKFQNP